MEAHVVFVSLGMRLSLFSVIYRPGLANHCDLDLARVVHGVFDIFGDIACQADGSQVVDILRLDENSHFTASLQGEGLADAPSRSAPSPPTW